jgi:hypothetical protein
VEFRERDERENTEANSDCFSISKESCLISVRESGPNPERNEDVERNERWDTRDIREDTSRG